MTEEHKESKLVLPKTFDKCPNCGCAETFCQEALKADFPAEKMEKNPPVLLSAELVTQPPGRLYPIRLIAIMDVCVECGTVYAIVLEKLVGRPTGGGGGDGKKSILHP